VKEKCTKYKDSNLGKKKNHQQGWTSKGTWTNQILKPLVTRGISNKEREGTSAKTFNLHESSSLTTTHFETKVA
jgi:hypothetical protein